MSDISIYSRHVIETLYSLAQPPMLIEPPKIQSALQSFSILQFNPCPKSAQLDNKIRILGRLEAEILNAAFSGQGPRKGSFSIFRADCSLVVGCGTITTNITTNHIYIYIMLTILEWPSTKDRGQICDASIAKLVT